MGESKRVPYRSRGGVRITKREERRNKTDGHKRLGQRPPNDQTTKYDM